jgi:hypothetical protein
VIYPALRQYFIDMRDEGRYVDAEDMVLEFEALLLTLKLKLERKKGEGVVFQGGVEARACYCLAASIESLQHQGLLGEAT